MSNDIVDISTEINNILGNINEVKPLSNELSTLWLNNEIIPKFNKCYDYLTKIYNETTLSRQVIRDPTTQDIIYTSNNLNYNFSKNYLGLAFYNYLIEYEIFYITHIERLTHGTPSSRSNFIANGIHIKTYDDFLRDNISVPVDINARTYKINMLPTDFSSNFISDSDNYTLNPNGTRTYNDPHSNSIRTYKNVLKENNNFKNNNKLINDFTTLLITFTDNFINNLINDLTIQFNKPQNKPNKLTNSGHIKNKIIESIIPNFAITLNIQTKWNYIYDNWTDRICELIINEINDPKIEYENINDLRNQYNADPNKDKTALNMHIYNNILETIEKTFSNVVSNDYIADGTGLFSWSYLINYKNPDLNLENKLYQSCVTVTVIEQYLLYKLYFTPKDIYFYTEYTKSIDVPHNIWSYTQSEYSKDFKKKSIITHWVTIINNKYSNEKKLIRSAMNNPADPFGNNKKINLIKNRNTYFKLLVYYVFDDAINYLYKNISKLQSIQIKLYIDAINKIYIHVNNSITGYTTDISLEKISENFTEVDQQLITNLNYTDLVNNIISGSQQNPIDKITNSVFIETTPDSKDTNEWLKSLSTDFINKYFFSFDIITANLMNLINNVFNEGIKTYFERCVYYNNIRATGKVNYEDYIIFIFKGGNIMAYVLYSLINQLPYNMKSDIITVFKRCFKKSDSDFSIIIKDISVQIGKIAMDTIYKEITDLSYLLLNRIRDIMMTDLQNYCSFYSFSDKKRKSLIVNKLLKSINDTPNEKRPDEHKNIVFNGIEYDNIFYNTLTVQDETINSMEKLLKHINNNQPKRVLPPKQILQLANKDDLTKYNDFGSSYDRNSRRDFKIEAVQKDNTAYVKVSKLTYLHEAPELFKNFANDIALEKKVFINKSETNFYITHNTSINVNEPNEQKRFNLVRVKVNIKLHYLENADLKPKLINIPGEFIDVSIPHYVSNNKYFKPTQKLIINKYKMNVNEDDNINYDFNAYSFETFFYDLISALFDNKKYDDVKYKIDMPWYNTKMEKRVERIMLFIVIDIAKKTIFQRDLNIIKKEIVNTTEINKYNIKIQDLNEDMIKLNKIFQDIVNLCNGNINNIENINTQFKSLNTLLETNIFAINTNGVYTNYLLKFFITEILVKLNNNFIFIINEKILNRLDNVDNNYYFKTIENKEEFKKDTYSILYKKIGFFYDIIVKFINNILIHKFINKMANYKPDLTDISEFEPIKL